MNKTISDFVQTEQMTLREKVASIMQQYFANLEGEEPSNLYNFVLEEVEAPLLEEIMKYTRYNQSRSARMLGISRGTLRKLLKKYGLL
jgi:Fis family transcriptional regulator